MARGRPKLGADEALAATERRRVQSAERMRRMRERRRAEASVRQEPTTAQPLAEPVTPPTSNRKGGIGGDRLRVFVERIERLEEELRALPRSRALAAASAAERRHIQADIDSLYAEAESSGFTVAVLQEVIRIRKMSQEQRSVLPLYLQALEQ